MSHKTGQQRFADWLASQGIELVELISNGQNVDDDGWDHNAYVFRVRNRRAGIHRPMSFNYRTGMGWTEKPKLIHLFGSICNETMDADMYADWRDYAEQFESDIDELPYRAVQRYQSTWTAMTRQSEKVHRLLPDVDLGETVAPMLEEAGL